MYKRQALALGSVISHIPLAALAGVLMVTAWRMNEWHVIRFYLHRRLKSATGVMLVTMAATVALDLTQAILLGVGLSLLVFLGQVSRLQIVPTEVDWERIRRAGHQIQREVEGMRVVYVSGALYFGAVSQLTETLEALPPSRVLVLSMRGVPMVDVSCVHALEHFWHIQRQRGGVLLITGLQPQVQKLFERTGLVDEMGQGSFFWSADQAIVSAKRQILAQQDATTNEMDLSDEAAMDDMPMGVVPVE